MDILFKLEENPNIKSKPTAELPLVSHACTPKFDEYSIL